MNSQIQALCAIAQKPSRRIIGLMSGTSLDGLDVALCNISGAGETTRVLIEQFKTVTYSDSIKDQIRTVFAKTTIDFQRLTLLNGWIGALHANMVLECLRLWQIEPKETDAIASHGQTVMHAPKALHGLPQFSNATLQIGDGDHIAVATGILTLSDFRQKHIAAGGEGAPLAVYGDYYLFSKLGEHRIMLNLGGIGNFTFLPADAAADRVFVTDTGTSNTLLDAYVRHHFAPLAYDKNAALARQGKVNDSLLAALLDNPFFKQPFPKTTGPELFNLQYLALAAKQSRTTQLSPHDVLATLTRFSAQSIAEAIDACAQQNHIPLNQLTIYLSGGGAHNPLLTDWLKHLLPCRFSNTDSLGIQGDAKEAVLFAVLANETLCGGQSDFGKRRGIPSVSMGKISFPR